MDQQKFKGIMERAQQLMLDPEFNEKVDRKSHNYAKSGSVSDGSDLKMFEQEAFGGRKTVVSENREMAQINNNNGNLNYDKLPEFMRESFKNTPPIQGDISAVDPLSSIEEGLSLNNKREIINETVKQPTYSSVGGIDYSLIKTIIDESVKRNISEIKKDLMNESTTISGFHIGKGNKVQFLDSKGNIYEGILKLKAKKKING